MALTLYGAPRSRASLVRWYLEERGVPYHWQPLDLAAKEQQQPPFLAINPFGKVPALVDASLNGGEGKPLALFESGAILLHVAERHAMESQHPAWRALSLQWVMYANASLGPALVAAAARPEELTRQLAVLDPLVAEGRSLLAPLGEAASFSAADCAVWAYLAYIPLFCKQLDLSPFPGVRASIESTLARPAYRKAMGLE